MIFSNILLIEMVAYLTTNENEFFIINSVIHRKLETYGSCFFKGLMNINCYNKQNKLPFLLEFPYNFKDFHFLKGKRYGNKKKPFFSG